MTRPSSIATPKTGLKSKHALVAWICCSLGFTDMLREILFVNESRQREAIQSTIKLPSPLTLI